MTFRIGVIGVGIIGEPVVRGLVAAHGPAVEIALSPRTAARAAALAAEFPNVRIAGTNQAVVDDSDWVVLAVLPEAAEAIIRPLAFRPDHHVVSLISTAKVATLQEWTSTPDVTRLVPLPYVAQRMGPIAAYPLTAAVEEVFGGLGTLVPTPDERGLETMSTITSMQSAFFAAVAEVAGWAGRHGVTPEAAQRFTLDFFAALLTKAGTLTPSDLAEHWREMTPGGFNYTAITYLQEHGAITAWSDAMDAVLTRKQGGN